MRVAVRTAVRYAVAGAHRGQNRRGSGSICDESPEFVALECFSSLLLRETPGLRFEVPESPGCVLLLSCLRSWLLSCLRGWLLSRLRPSSCLIRHGHFSFCFKSWYYRPSVARTHN